MNQLFCFLCGVSNYNINLRELSPLLNYHMIFVYMPDAGIVNISLHNEFKSLFPKFIAALSNGLV